MVVSPREPPSLEEFGEHTVPESPPRALTPYRLESAYPRLVRRLPLPPSFLPPNLRVLTVPQPRVSPRCAWLNSEAVAVETLLGTPSAVHVYSAEAALGATAAARAAAESALIAEDTAFYLRVEWK